MWGFSLMAPIVSLFFLIFLEGYVVLSTELLAIRLLVPFTGSGTDTVSIIIAAILLPLSVGYFAGGTFKAKLQKSKRALTVRKKLIWNLVIAAGILTFGLSYAFLNSLFDALENSFSIYNRLVLTALYCAVFVVYPVFLLGQTVPLISNYFSRERLPIMAGRILFFSTLGSFIGAILSTLVLMAFLGVHYTVTITIACMVLLVFIISKNKISAPTILITLWLAIALGLNSGAVMNHMHIVSNNKYSTVQVIERNDAGVRQLKINRSNASTVNQGAPDTFEDYIAYIEDNFLVPIFTEGSAKDILVLGAGGFTVGREDVKNHYTYVDIDGTLKEIVEKQFLKENLTPNKNFVPMDARAYLLQNPQKYDVIVVDLFRDTISVHENFNTLEFFLEAKAHLKPEGVLVANYWASPTFADAYSRHLDSTLRAAFPQMNRQVVDTYNAWEKENDWKNVIYSYVNNPSEKTVLYTDNQNTSMYDKPYSMPHRKTEK